MKMIQIRAFILKIHAIYTGENHCTKLHEQPLVLGVVEIQHLAIMETSNSLKLLVVVVCVCVCVRLCVLFVCVMSRKESASKYISCASDNFAS